MPEKTRKTAVLFDVDDTLYDQTVPFKEAYAEYCDLPCHEKIQRPGILPGDGGRDHNGRNVYLPGAESL